jgi:hypothetical protein
MTNDNRAAWKPRSGTELPEPVAPRKPYHSPKLQDWGSIVELTGGPRFDFTDADFNGGSGAT